jgi:hypothetical protein
MGYYHNKVNHEYFNNIDSEYKAYMLGLLYADGSIYLGKGGNRQHRLSIALQEEDGYILSKFAEDVGNVNVKIVYPPSIAKRNWKKRALVRISSNELCNTLISYGCNVNKSAIGMNFPMLEDEYYKHFIRGFMDGDGSVILKKVNYKYKRKKSYKLSNPHIQRYALKIAFASTDKEFLLKVSEILKTSRVYIRTVVRKQEVYTLWIEGQEDVPRILNWLYEGAAYFLKRKHDKFLEYNTIIKSQVEGTLSEGLTTT